MRFGLRISEEVYTVKGNSAEFRRLTMRGVAFSRVRVARKLALACSNSRHQRMRFLGCTGGKGP